MMYPYMTLTNGVEIVHSGIELHEGRETVRVYFEKPTASKSRSFNTAECLLPAMTWSGVVGFSADELIQFMEFIARQRNLFFEFARKGGIGKSA